MTPDEARRRGTLSVEEAAALLGIGRDAVYSAVHAGTLPRLPVPGRVVRLPAGHLLEILGYPTRDVDTREDDAGSTQQGRSADVLPFASVGTSTEGAR